MPLHVTIQVNEREISQVHVGRMRGSAAADSINDYVAVLGPVPNTYEEWIERGESFTHRYGDGAEVCVLKALQALGFSSEMEEE